MKKFVLTLCFLALLSSPVWAGYSELVEDLPLMEDMVEDKESIVAFDKPAGRIVEFSAFVGASLADVQAFYTKSLPALGWEHRGGLDFTRGPERLLIKLEQGDNGVEVLFSLAPR